MQNTKFVGKCLSLKLVYQRKFQALDMEHRATAISLAILGLFGLIILLFVIFDNVKLGDLGAALAAAISAIAFIWLYVSIKTQIRELKEQSKLRSLSVAQNMLEISTPALDLYSFQIAHAAGLDIPARDNFDLSEAPYVVLNSTYSDESLKRAGQNLGKTAIAIPIQNYCSCYAETIHQLENLDPENVLRNSFEHSVYSQLFEQLFTPNEDHLFD